MKQETRSLTLVSLEVGELPGGGCHEIPRDAQDYREHRADYCEEQALVPLKDTAVLREIILPEYPQEPVNIFHTHLLPGEHHDGA